MDLGNSTDDNTAARDIFGSKMCFIATSAIHNPLPLLEITFVFSLRLIMHSSIVTYRLRPALEEEMGARLAHAVN